MEIQNKEIDSCLRFQQHDPVQRFEGIPTNTRINYYTQKWQEKTMKTFYIYEQEMLLMNEPLTNGINYTRGY